MRFWNSKKKEIDHHAPPPAEKGWDSFALALASGAGIIAVTVLEIEFFPALIIGEVAGVALSTAQKRHEAKQQRLHDWHMSLVGHNIDRILDRLLEKPVDSLTDRDKIQLALLSDWGLIAEDRMAGLSAAKKGEILHTQIVLSAQQQGVSVVTLAEKFAFPKLTPEERRSEQGLRQLEADRALLKEMLLQKKDPHWTAKLRNKFGRTLAGKVVERMARDVKAVGSTFGLAMEIPSLKKIWNILSAKGPADSAEHFMQRMAKDLGTTYERGLTRARCATRRHLRQSGIPHESVLLPKPEGGKRQVVRRKEGPAI